MPIDMPLMRQHLFAAAILTFPLALLGLLTLWLCDGSLAYTLDDPYIHLTLARNIWAGTYGINPGEAAAPSSSIIWPFLLAPLSGIAGFEWAPLGINILCTAGSASLLMRLFAEAGWIRALFISFMLMLSMNLYGLVFTGMEHSLQALLILIILQQLLAHDQTRDSQTTLTSLHAALFVLPLIRYEGLAISVPILAYLYFTGKKQPVIITSICLLSALTVFSLALHSRGLGLLPSSVVAKLGQGGIIGVVKNAYFNIKAYGFMVAILTAALLSTRSLSRTLKACLVAITLLHFLFGKHGWYGRYEVYYLLLIVTWLLQLPEISAMKKTLLAAVLPFAFSDLVLPTLTTPLAASNILNQQFKVAEIVKALDRPVAVNDLGVVSFKSHRYVLDLWGLGSKEALELRLQHLGDSTWTDGLMQKHDVNIAIVYDAWFPSLPAAWHKVASMETRVKKITLGEKTVSFYATNPAQAADLLQAIRDVEGRQQSAQVAFTYF